MPIPSVDPAVVAWCVGAMQGPAVPEATARSICGMSGKLRRLPHVVTGPQRSWITEAAHGRVTTAATHIASQSDVRLPTVFPADAIACRVRELGAEISAAYAGREPILTLVLHGAFIFAADLSRVLTTPHRVESLALTSYQGRESSGQVRIVKDLGCDIAGQDVLIVEDIVDTGRTLAATLDVLEPRHPRSIEVVTLLDKPSRRLIDVTPRWVGFEIEDVFVVGYGLDLDGRFRGLPYIANADAFELNGGP